MDMVLIIQYIDTIKEISGKSKLNVVFSPHTPRNVKNLGTQIQETIFSEQKLNENDVNKKNIYMEKTLQNKTFKSKLSTYIHRMCSSNCISILNT